MKAIMFIICLAFSFSSSAQITLNDSLNLIYSVYQLKELDKAKFNNPKHPERSTFVMYKVGKNEEVKVFKNRHLIIKDINVYFYTRAYIIGLDINYWLVIDQIDWSSAKATITCRAVTSKDAWIETFDQTDLCIEVKFSKDGDNWVQTSNRVTKK